MTMLAYEQINEIARNIAAATLAADNFDDAYTESTVDSRGEDALRITIVIRPGAVERLSGDAILDTLIGITRRLEQAGDERLPIVEYATRAELESSDDPES